jgi:4-hydroxy-3-polyprenylbenzoate decarboxylase
MSAARHKTIALAMTGASGAQYGMRLLQQLIAADCQVYFMISKAAQMVVALETDWSLPGRPPALEVYLQREFNAAPGQVRVFGREDWTAPVASGSSRVDAMVICPASTGVLSAIATGASNNLIERAADVALKERRTLIVVPRETPLSAIQLENMLALTRMGAVVVPACPGFYNKPQQVADLVDFMVARVLNLLDIPQQLLPEWGQLGRLEP